MDIIASPPTKLSKKDKNKISSAFEKEAPKNSSNLKLPDTNRLIAENIPSLDQTLREFKKKQ